MSQSGLKLHGAKEIKNIMEALGPAISKRAGTTGVRKGALLLKNALKAESPKVTGTLRREWSVKKLRARRNSSSVKYAIRIRRRHYYRVLELGFKDGRPATHPFAEKTMMATKARVFATLMAATRTALAVEAGRSYAKSLRVSRRR